MPERIRIVGLIMMCGPSDYILQMTSQAKHLSQELVKKPSEFILTALYVILNLPELAIND